MKERGENVLALIPLDLDGYLFNGWNSGKAAQIRQRLAADFQGWEIDYAKCEAEIECVNAVWLGSDENAREKPQNPSCDSSSSVVGTVRRCFGMGRFRNCARSRSRMGGASQFPFDYP